MNTFAESPSRTSVNSLWPLIRLRRLDSGKTRFEDLSGHPRLTLKNKPRMQE